MPAIYIRPAIESDLPALTAIYNEAVTATTATLDLEPWTVEGRKAWFLAHNRGNYPLLAAVLSETEAAESVCLEKAGQDIVSETDGTRVAGYASLSPLFPMAAYAASVELSVYVASEYRKRGIGGQLMRAILTLARQDADTHMVVSKITKENEASVCLHEKYGFQKTGMLKEIAWKFGRRLDVELYQLCVEELEETEKV